MKERPILFSDEMVRAILGDRKTQTRRAISTRGYELRVNAGIVETNLGTCDGSFRKWLGVSPYGCVGDRLWVRETFQIVEPHGSVDDEWIGDDIIEVDGRLPHDKPDSIGTWWNIIYRADGDMGVWYRPSIFMPRWASRIMLDITAVRIERVQDISIDDCWSEGIIGRGNDHDVWANAVDDYQSLWDRINAKRGYPWASNPWVWVIEFKRCPEVVSSARAD